MNRVPFPSLQAAGAPSLSRAQTQGIYILGYGTFAHDLARAAEQTGIPVLGFVVSGVAPQPKDHRPVWSLTQPPPHDTDQSLWVGVYNHQAHSDYQLIAQLCQAAQWQAWFPQHYFELVAPAMGWRYWLTDRQQYASHTQELEAAFGQLGDAVSRQAFSDTVAFRLGQSPRAAPPDEREPHYFPDFAVRACLARPQGAEAFLDGGAYDGDTLTAALRQIPFDKTFAFEPDLKNYAALARRTRSLQISAVNYPCGLSGRNEQLRFSTGQGEACAVKEDGDSVIQVVRLDDCLQNTRIDYLKLDVEGQEIPTLAGGRDLILRNRPILAIAAYHRWDDLWRIPAFVSALSLNYQLAYRSHSRNSFDGVFYAY